jgi:hypothetical protein
VFNRLDTTKQVFEAIREAKPPRLYVAADGARANKEGEAEKVQAVREYVMNNIDWDCEVKTLFREQNYGCKMAVSGAIDWFFENEEMGIILEDDCLPSQSFFWFCEELLERYKDDMRVGQISGDNFQKGVKRGDADYYFSIYNHIWGWASWANRWKNYEVDLNSINDTQFIKEVFIDKNTQKYWTNVFKTMKAMKIDTWDYQWTFCLWKNKQLTILPNINLIKNIGFGVDATHTIGESEFAKMQVYDIVINNHPDEIIQDKEADSFTFKNHFAPKPFLVRVINKIKRILK